LTGATSSKGQIFRIPEIFLREIAGNDSRIPLAPQPEIALKFRRNRWEACMMRLADPPTRMAHSRLTRAPRVSSQWRKPLKCP
jgi:hypothetical protein